MSETASHHASKSEVRGHGIHAASSALLLLTVFTFGGTARADEASVLFDDSFVHEIRMYFDDSDWYDTLYTNYDNGDAGFYLPCRWEYYGSDEPIVLDDVGARFKGNSSFLSSDTKKSFKIDFNELVEGQEFLGLRKLNLNNNFRDPSLLREKLFLDFLAQWAPIHRCVHARVFINDELWGLFLLTEQVDKTFCERMFGGNEDGNLYKGEMQGTLAYLGEDPEEYRLHYEKKTNEEEDDWTDLIGFTSVLDSTPDGDVPQVLPQIIEYDALIEHLAANILFANLDQYIGPAHNFYMYHRDDTDQFVHLIWDCNMAFGNFRQGLPQGFDIIQLDLTWNNNSRPLAEAIWDAPVLVHDHYRAMARMIRTGFDSATMDPRIDELADLIRADVYADPYYEYTTEVFETSLYDDVPLGGPNGVMAVGLKRFVADRGAFVENALDALASRDDLQVNELMTLNSTIIVDEAGDHDPWLEIYNLGPGLVNINNVFLTDDPGVPDLWELPVEDLDDGQHRFYWIDGEPGEGTGHAPFVLDPAGGQVYLFKAAGQAFELIDSVTYPALPDDIGWGRSGEESGIWGLTIPTPGANNMPTHVLAGQIFINEFMAKNDSTIEDPDEPGAFEDWIEIFNNSSGAVDLGGLYMSDDPAEPQEWQIPVGTIMAPGDHLLIWADEDVEQGPLHADFKLSVDGESISIRGADGVSLIDSYTFGPQAADISTGRTPDGGETWMTFDEPTPGSANAADCPADLDGDGSIGFADLLTLLAAWGTPAGDVDGDGVTGFSDLITVLAAWGLCTG